MEIIVVALLTAVVWSVSTLTGGLFDREPPLSKSQFDRVDAHMEAEERKAREYEAFIAAHEASEDATQSSDGPDVADVSRR